MVAYISGHLDLTEEEFEEHYVPFIEKALERGDTFIIGDARGADSLAQAYLWDCDMIDHVTVYHMYTQPRNNVGNYKTVDGFKTDLDRDEAMTENSDYDIAWVRPGREKSGTQKNIDRRKKQNTIKFDALIHEALV